MSLSLYNIFEHCHIYCIYERCRNELTLPILIRTCLRFSKVQFLLDPECLVTCTYSAGIHHGAFRCLNYLCEYIPDLLLQGAYTSEDLGVMQTTINPADEQDNRPRKERLKSLDTFRG